ncbi:type IV secretion system protein VirB4, putative, partial [Wolbachia endosymbiont of Drosophila ananassae]
LSLLNTHMQLKVPTVNSKLKKKNNLALLESIDLDFVPYACHYDEETILTKQEGRKGGSKAMMEVKK